jgi:hypothetical protein
MDKLNGKKQVASKKKEPKSENKIRTVKKMKGGEHKKYNLKNKQELQEFKNFVEENFTLTNNSRNQYHSNYKLVKDSIIHAINSHIKTNHTQNYLFYIFQTTTNEIICIGEINNFAVDYLGKKYIHIPCILAMKKGERGGIGALYHLLLLVQDKEYAGICLTSTPSSNSFYKHLGFIEMNKRYTFVDTLFFDKENLAQIEAKLPHPITTEFHSTYSL